MTPSHEIRLYRSIGGSFLSSTRSTHSQRYTHTQPNRNRPFWLVVHSFLLMYPAVGADPLLVLPTQQAFERRIRFSFSSSFVRPRVGHFIFDLLRHRPRSLFICLSNPVTLERRKEKRRKERAERCSGCALQTYTSSITSTPPLRLLLLDNRSMLSGA